MVPLNVSVKRPVKIMKKSHKKASTPKKPYAVSAGATLPSRAGTERLSGAAAPPGTGHEFVGDGVKYFAGPVAPPGAGQNNLLGLKILAGANPDPWRTLIKSKNRPQ